MWLTKIWLSSTHFSPCSVADFDFSNDPVWNVCATSNPVLNTEIWVFSPPAGTENGNYNVTTITGPPLMFCVFNNTELNNTGLSVTLPSTSAENGTFDVTFVSEETITLPVSYGTCIASLIMGIVCH